MWWFTGGEIVLPFLESFWSHVVSNVCLEASVTETELCELRGGFIIGVRRKTVYLLGVTTGGFSKLCLYKLSSRFAFDIIFLE